MQTPVSEIPLPPTRPRPSGHPVDPRPAAAKMAAATPQQTATTAPIAVKDASAGANTINEKKVPSVGANTINEKKKGSSVGANTINKNANAIDVIFKETFDIKNEKKKMYEAAKSIDNRTLQLLQKNIEINQGLTADNEKLTKENDDLRQRETAALMDAAEARKKMTAEKSAKEAVQEALNEQNEVVESLRDEMIGMRGCAEMTREMNIQLNDVIEKCNAKVKTLRDNNNKELDDLRNKASDEIEKLRSELAEARDGQQQLQNKVEMLESEIDLKSKSNESFASMMGSALGSHCDAAVLWRTFEQSFRVRFAEHVYGTPRKREHSPEEQTMKTPPPSASPSEASCSSTHGDAENHGRKRRRNE